MGVRIKTELAVTGTVPEDCPTGAKCRRLHTPGAPLFQESLTSWREGGSRICSKVGPSTPEQEHPKNFLAGSFHRVRHSLAASQAFLEAPGQGLNLVVTPTPPAVGRSTGPLPQVCHMDSLLGSDTRRGLEKLPGNPSVQPATPRQEQEIEPKWQHLPRRKLEVLIWVFKMQLPSCEEEGGGKMLTAPQRGNKTRAKLLIATELALSLLAGEGRKEESI